VQYNNYNQDERINEFNMKRTVQSTFFIFAVALLFSCTVLVSPAFGGLDDHGFSVKEYEEFHKVLEPLQHEALPKNDFNRIRTKGRELVKLGEAIQNLGVPRGVDEKNKEEFKEWLGKFSEALIRFKRDAGGGTDEQLRESYSAVHDSFEMLAGMLPKK
jgi:hypothetical protein